MGKFKIGDREYEFDGEYTLDEAMLFYDKANVGMGELQRELARGNPYVTVTLMFILKKRAGEAVRWQDMQAHKITDFQYVPDETDSVDDATADGGNTGEAPDPTQGTGATPEPDTAATS